MEETDSGAVPGRLPGGRGQKKTPGRVPEAPLADPAASRLPGRGAAEGPDL